MSISDKGWARMVDDYINGKTRMYAENRKSINWFVGCEFNCVYCKPSFQRQMKRQGKRCRLCYEYEPHAHLERLNKAPPKTVRDEFIFFPSSADVSFARPFEMKEAITYMEKYGDRLFLVQAKNPKCFAQYVFPSNVLLGTTLETDYRNFFPRRGLYGIPKRACTYKSYDDISKAPIPAKRHADFLEVPHKRKVVTIEPILDFNMIVFKSNIMTLNPEIVYVGYDNHNCKLPEPRLSKTVKLIEELEKFTEVRFKSLRKAWWEGTP